MDRTGGRRRHWRFVGSEGRLEDVRERPRPRPAPVEILPGASHALKSGTKPPPCRTEWFPVPQTLSGDHGFRYVRKSLAQSPLSHSTFLTLWGQAGHVLGWPVRGASTRRQQMGTLSFLWVVAQRRLCWAPGDKGGPVQRNTGRAVLTGGRPASGAAARPPLQGERPARKNLQGGFLSYNPHILPSWPRAPCRTQKAEGRGHSQDIRECHFKQCALLT